MMTPQESLTVIELINRTSGYFKGKKLENPRLNAEQLLGHVLNLSRVQLYVSFERPVLPEELERFREVVKRRAASEPLQYILGQTDFMGLTFKVGPGVLIPRPETERLVEESANTIESAGLQSGRLLDIGTGSGCIAISLKKQFPSLHVTAIDISEQSLQKAVENAAQNQVNDITFVKHDIFNPWPEQIDSRFDMIVSNPPYISAPEFQQLPEEIRKHEPAEALTDRSDGLSYYKQIITLVRQGSPLQAGHLLMEMSGTNAGSIDAIAGDAGFSSVEILNDYNQLPRILKIKVK